MALAINIIYNYLATLTTGTEPGTGTSRLGVVNRPNQILPSGSMNVKYTHKAKLLQLYINKEFIMPLPTQNFIYSWNKYILMENRGKTWWVILCLS